MVEQDNRTEDEIKQVIELVFNDSFWKKNIRSAGKLREQWNAGKLDGLKSDVAEKTEQEYVPYYRKLN